jgi:hypothetical protein
MNTPIKLCVLPFFIHLWLRQCCPKTVMVVALGLSTTEDCNVVTETLWWKLCDENRLAPTYVWKNIGRRKESISDDDWLKCERERQAGGMNLCVGMTYVYVQMYIRELDCLSYVWMDKINFHGSKCFAGSRIVLKMNLQMNLGNVRENSATMSTNQTLKYSFWVGDSTQEEKSSSIKWTFFPS